MGGVTISLADSNESCADESVAQNLPLGAAGGFKNTAAASAPTQTSQDATGEQTVGVCVWDMLETYTLTHNRRGKR